MVCPCFEYAAYFIGYSSYAPALALALALALAHAHAFTDSFIGQLPFLN
jgi:hypothetical protein